MTLEVDGRKVYSVGWVGSAGQAEVDLWQPAHPKTMTKADTIAAWMENTLADAPVLPFVGTMSEVCVLDSSGKQVFGAPDAKQFLSWACAMGNFHAMSLFGDAEIIPAVFVGFNIKQLFLSIAAELWREGIPTPFRFWHSPPGLFDLNDLLIPGALRNGFDVGSLLAYGANKFLPPEYAHLVGPGNAIMPDAECRSRVSLALARFSQLI